jgi:peptide/nickel transport system substrate-binding protein
MKSGTSRFVKTALRFASPVFLTLLFVAQAASQPVLGQAGGRLRVVQRSEPRTFHPVFAVDEPSRTILGLLFTPLLRINPETNLAEGILAESWKLSRDGRQILVKLRPGLKFSDGSAIRADDVVFTYSLHLDAKVASPQRELLNISGQPVQVTKVGELSLEFRLAKPSALGERLLAGIAILPRHILEPLYLEGKLSSAWALTTPPAQIVGGGPFRLKLVQPGQRIVLQRNPYYGKKDRAGKQLPYLDEIEFLSASGEDAQVARLLTGEADLISAFGGSSFRAIQAAAERTGIRPVDAGPSLDYTFLLFNLNPSPGGRPARDWFELEAFRKAISFSVDRAAIARLVYRERASAIWGPVSPARRQWFDPTLSRPPQSADEARKLLSAASFRWDANGRLLDPKGVPVSFTVIANSANPAYTQTASILEEDLKKIGLELRVVQLEFRSLVNRVVNQRDFDAAIMALRPGDVDPAADINAFVSQGRTRLWNLSGKSERPWEAEIDQLMREQLEATDFKRRRELFNRVQGLFARYMPMVCLVSPNLLYASRDKLRNLRPGVIGDLVLWNAEELFWETGGNTPLPGR